MDIKGILRARSFDHHGQKDCGLHLPMKLAKHANSYPHGFQKASIVKVFTEPVTKVSIKLICRYQSFHPPEYTCKRSDTARIPFIDTVDHRFLDSPHLPFFKVTFCWPFNMAVDPHNTDKLRLGAHLRPSRLNVRSLTQWHTSQVPHF